MGITKFFRKFLRETCYYCGEVITKEEKQKKEIVLGFGVNTHIKCLKKKLKEIK